MPRSHSNPFFISVRVFHRTVESRVSWPVNKFAILLSPWRNARKKILIGSRTIYHRRVINKSGMNKIQCFKNFKIYIGHEKFPAEHTHFSKYKYVIKIYSNDQKYCIIHRNKKVSLMNENINVI